MEVLDDVARTARLHNAVGDGDRVDAVAIGALVGAAILGARDVELDDAGVDLGAGGRGHQLVVARARRRRLPLERGEQLLGCCVIQLNLQALGVVTEGPRGDAGRDGRGTDGGARGGGGRGDHPAAIARNGARKPSEHLLTRVCTNHRLQHSQVRLPDGDVERPRIHVARSSSEAEDVCSKKTQLCSQPRLKKNLQPVCQKGVTATDPGREQ